jgi:tetratricopeptide (TPR) repeat protein
LLDESHRYFDKTLTTLQIILAVIAILVAMFWRRAEKKFEFAEDALKKARESVKRIRQQERLAEEAKDRISGHEKSLDASQRTKSTKEDQPDTIDHLYQSYLFSEKGLYDSALRECEAAIFENDKNEDAWFFRGSVLSKLRRYEDAANSHHRAYSIDPNSVGALNSAGLNLAKLDRHDEAIACYNKLPHYSPALFNMACSYALLRDKRNMLGSLSKAIDSDKSNREFAETESAFEFYRTDPDFRKLVGLE